METKELKIIESANHLFHRHGYRKVTMSDIAEASKMSRPSLYAVFENKEAVLSGLIKLQIEQDTAKTKAQVEQQKNLKAKLASIFEIWIITPFTAVIDSDNGAELLANVSTYAPAAMTELYRQFELHLLEVLKPEITEQGTMAAEDVAHILMLATKGLKASTATLAELRRMIEGLITMAIATVGQHPPTSVVAQH
jgi:AcrR family transcriptional regulator